MKINFAEMPPETAEHWANFSDANRLITFYLSIWTRDGWQLIPPCEGPYDNCGKRHQVALC